MPKVCEKYSPHAAEVMARIQRGEGMVAITKHCLLREFHRATILRWIFKGRLPACRIGSRWYSTDSCIREAFEKENRPKPPADASHLAAKAKLRAAGILKD
jgi:hypothetical protein